MAGSRTFTVEQASRSGKKLRFNGGRYHSDTPSDAAKKAFTQISRNMRTKGKLSIEIHIRETTQNSKHKIYTYRVTRIKDEREVERDGQIIVYRYTTKTKAI
jgi:DNA-binding transcriptional regulator WhiA